MIMLCDNLCRPMISNNCCGDGFVVFKPIQKRLGLRVVENALFGLSSCFLMESAVNRDPR
jgi:hypothetical protein